MTIDLRQPSLTVTLYKNVGRTTVNGTAPVSQLYSGQQRVVDLTPYISESGGIRTQKSVRGGAGAFSISLADKIDADVMDTLYAVIEPMDYIEIRMAANAWLNPGQKPPVMMRGFVSQVQRVRGMGSDGKPARRVIISGQDYGKVLQIAGVWNYPYTPSGSAALITSFPTFEQFGDFPNNMEVSAFMALLFAKVVTPYLALLQQDPKIQAANDAITAQIASLSAQVVAINQQAAALEAQGDALYAAGNTVAGDALYAQSSAVSASSQSYVDQVTALKAQLASSASAPTTSVLPLTLDCQVTGPKVSPSAAGNISGSVLSIIRGIGDIGPWNEFFVEDRESGPFAVYRPNPFMDAVSKEYVLDGVTPPAVVSITAEDVISITEARSDENVSNFYWIQAPLFAMNYDQTSKLNAFQSQSQLQVAPVDDSAYGNSLAALYGRRKMEETTRQQGPDETNTGNGTAAGQARQENQGEGTGWQATRREQLRNLNKDNVIFESGSMRLKGNENIRAGRILQITSGSVTSQYYIVSDSQDYTPYGAYFTEIQYERGTGFINRIQRASIQDSPYWDELVLKLQ